jgi:hypothetical protein
MEVDWIRRCEKLMSIDRATDSKYIVYQCSPTGDDFKKNKVKVYQFGNVIEEKHEVR